MLGPFVAPPGATISVALAVWPRHLPLTPESFAADLSPEVALGFTASLDVLPSWRQSPADPSVAAFHTELTTQYPDLTEDNYTSSPWAVPLLAGKHTVLMHIVFTRASEICHLVTSLADHHNLHYFDPTSDEWP
ncbi:hypothetical protein [Acrocarpospora catenulata]|uniref:hypothetical protein n=1 Tax=Acrocarpospora catenulata TaxID=2836182 RepID=UPI001BDA878B|nr:hypothetical protein [Acrocarpospora catenulata]